MLKPFMHAYLIVIDTLQFLNRLIHPGIDSSSFGRDSLTMIGITHRGPPLPRLRRGNWSPPALDWHALHIVGLSLSTDASVGGVIRDHRGAFVGAVAGPSGLVFGRSVDVHALLRGVDLADHAGCGTIDVWTVSHFLVDNISLPTPLWDCERSWARIMEFGSTHGMGTHHTRRRGCALAIAMAE